MLYEFRWDVSLERVFHSVDIMLKAVPENSSSGGTVLVEMERGDLIKMTA